MVYAGPITYFVVLLGVNRYGLRGIERAPLRWAALTGICAALTCLSALLVFALSVNVHLSLGGQI